MVFEQPLQGPDDGPCEAVIFTQAPVLQWVFSVARFNRGGGDSCSSTRPWSRSGALRDLNRGVWRMAVPSCGVPTVRWRDAIKGKPQQEAFQHQDLWPLA